jgi:hypothetical protein
MSIQVAEKGRCENIAGTGRVYFVGGIGGEILGATVLEEGCSMPPIRGYEEGYP